jgi:hypothetical protein
VGNEFSVGVVGEPGTDVVEKENYIGLLGRSTKNAIREYYLVGGMGASGGVIRRVEAFVVGNMVTLVRWMMVEVGCMKAPSGRGGTFNKEEQK